MTATSRRGSSSRTTGTCRALRRGRRRVPPRPRPFAFPALRPDARRRLPVGLQRCRNGDARRGDRRACARGGRTRLDRRRALRAARADRRRGGRCRRAALLALQVLRAAPRASRTSAGAAERWRPYKVRPAPTSRSGGASRRARSRTSSWRASSPPSSTSTTSAGTSSRSTNARWGSVPRRAA